MSELERPSVGDTLLLVTSRHRRDTTTNRLVKTSDVAEVKVLAVARYKVKVVVEGHYSPWEFDLRTGRAWNTRPGYPYSGPMLYTADGWKQHQLTKQARGYLDASGVHQHQLRGSLAEAVRKGRLVELANALREFEGLEPLT